MLFRPFKADDLEFDLPIVAIRIPRAAARLLELALPCLGYLMIGPLRGNRHRPMRHQSN